MVEIKDPEVNKPAAGKGSPVRRTGTPGHTFRVEQVMLPRVFSCSHVEFFPHDLTFWLAVLG